MMRWPSRAPSYPRSIQGTSRIEQPQALSRKAASSPSQNGRSNPAWWATTRLAGAEQRADRVEVERLARDHLVGDAGQAGDLRRDRDRRLPELAQGPDDRAQLSMLVIYEGHHAELDHLVAAVVEARRLDVDDDGYGFAGRELVVRPDLAGPDATEHPIVARCLDRRGGGLVGDVRHGHFFPMTYATMIFSTIATSLSDSERGRKTVSSSSLDSRTSDPNWYSVTRRNRAGSTPRSRHSARPAGELMIRPRLAFPISAENRFSKAA